MPDHDESVNYLIYPTLMPLPVQPDTEADQIQRLLAEIQRHATEMQWHAAELARVETELQRLLAAQQKGNAGSVGSHDQAEPSPAQQKRHSGGNSPAKHAPRPQKKQNILGNAASYKTVGKPWISRDGRTPKSAIREICFLNTLADAPRTAADVSAAQDGSVLCWTRGKVQYIAGEGGVTGGNSCVELLAGYSYVTAIRFNGNFDTSQVKNMCRMFYDCNHLEMLDLSGWDVSRVTNMGGMFRNCIHLRTLDLSGWDTSNVTNMRWMFNNCKSLTSFDPGWLATSHADTSYMYEGTRWE